MRRVSHVARTIVGALLMSVALGQGPTGAEGWPDDPGALALIEVYETILSEYYLSPADIDEDALWQGAIAGMIAALPDRYSEYQAPQELARLDALFSSGGVSGIGVRLLPVDSAAQVGPFLAEVYEGGPAQRGGLLAGDVILAVNGVDVRRSDIYAAQALIIGESSTRVRLLVGRPGATEPLSFELTRGKVNYPPTVLVDSRLLDDHVGYIRIEEFVEGEVRRQVSTQLRSLTKEGATALVLDLRDNLGGSLTEGYGVLNEFLANQPLWTLSRRGSATTRSATAGASELPLVVLVNRRSTSMSETIARALQQAGRALVVGEPTFGKGLTTHTRELRNGGMFTYVMHELLLPDGASVEGRGVLPDVHAPDTRRSRLVIAEGEGTEAGQRVTLDIDGEPVASTVATASGFDLVSTSTGEPYWAQPGSSVDITIDSALGTAVATVIALRDGTNAIGTTE